MKKTLTCREHAQECRSLAMRAPSEEQREQLRAMATTWDVLAEQRDKLLYCRALCAA